RRKQRAAAGQAKVERDKVRAAHVCGGADERVKVHVRPDVPKQVVAPDHQAAAAPDLGHGARIPGHDRLPPVRGPGDVRQVPPPAGALGHAQRPPDGVRRRQRCARPAAAAALPNAAAAAARAAERGAPVAPNPRHHRAHGHGRVRPQRCHQRI
ncbi:hypothetical protein IWQ57_006251, partial [Coemansia nantahalensis]